MAIAANTDQKRENLLNLSLSVSEEERMRSESLETGFDREERTWELIVKYFGDLSGLRERGIQVRELLSGYGILKVPEYLVDFRFFYIFNFWWTLLQTYRKLNI